MPPKEPTTTSIITSIGNNNHLKPEQIFLPDMAPYHEGIRSLLQEFEANGFLINLGVPNSIRRDHDGLVRDSLEIHISCGEESASNFGATLCIHDDNTVELQFTPLNHLSELGYSPRHIRNMVMSISIMLRYAKDHNLNQLTMQFDDTDQLIRMRSVIDEVIKTHYPDGVFYYDHDAEQIQIIIRSQFYNWVTEVNEGKAQYHFSVSPEAKLHLFTNAILECNQLLLVSKDPNSRFQRLEVKGDTVIIYTQIYIYGELYQQKHAIPKQRLNLYDFLDATPDTTLNDLIKLITDIIHRESKRPTHGSTIGLEDPA